MKRTLQLFFVSLALIGATFRSQAQSTAFTYHGRLNNNGVPVTGAYDMQFSIYDAEAAGGLVTGPLSVNALDVADGLFRARIDFGAGVFTGPARWLEIQVRPAGNGEFQTLSPRQELTSSPYSIRAQSAGTAADVSNGSVVKSLNMLKDDVTLVEGANVTIAPEGNTLKISSIGPGGSVWGLNGANAHYTAGNVGIGTTTPPARLSVFSSTASALDNTAVFFAPALGANASHIHYGSSGDWFVRSASTSGKVVLQDTGGNVGIGTQTPASKLDIAAQDALRITGYQPFITMSDANGFGLIRKANRYLQVVDGDLHFSYRPECNVIPCNQPTEIQMTIRNNGNVGIGTTTPQAKLHVVGTTRTSVLTITGGADIAEPFNMSSPDIPKGSVVVIDEANPGHLKLSTAAYDTRVAGVVSGANGIKPGISLHQEGLIEGGENVSLSGRVYVQADGAYGAIKPGDLLTTSDTPGHAMKVTDHNKAQGAILGKAMGRLKEGKGMVLVLVTLQ